MALAVLLVVACAGAAIGDFADYSNVKMPQYAEAEYYDSASAAVSDEYRDHSVDAPASLDYKFDEESNGKIKQSIVNENFKAEEWQRREKKHRTARLSSDSDLDVTIDKNNLDESIPKLKPNSRFVLSRVRSNDPDRNVRITYKRSKKSRRNSNDDTDRMKDDFQINKLVFGEEKPVDETGEPPPETEQVGDYLTARKTTERSARRKSRDKYVVEDQQRSDVEEEREVGSLSDRQMMREQDYSIESEQRRGRPADYDSPLLRPPQGQSRIRLKKYDYNDYYDMKRANDVKRKLPYHRTKARVALPSRSTARFRALPWTTRYTRTSPAAGRAPSPSSPLTTTPTMTTSTTTITTTTTSRITTYTVQALMKRDASAKNMSEELTVAERSRLSILKKAQKKERSHNATTPKKPPVLLLVSQRVNTMVVVEPPSSQEPWMRASIISNDSPDRLDKVKALMRHKLVANARHIHDLTDNWDEMICDYIDVTMLNDAVSVQMHSLLFIIVILIFLFNYCV